MDDINTVQGFLFLSITFNVVLLIINAWAMTKVDRLSDDVDNLLSEFDRGDDWYDVYDESYGRYPQLARAGEPVDDTLSFDRYEPLD